MGISQIEVTSYYGDSVRVAEVAHDGVECPHCGAVMADIAELLPGLECYQCAAVVTRFDASMVMPSTPDEIEIMDGYEMEDMF